MTGEKVWTVGARAKVYHQTRECIEKHRVEDGGVVVVEPRQTTIEKAERRNLRECQRCYSEQTEYTGGCKSKLERIIERQEQQQADD